MDNGIEARPDGGPVEGMLLPHAVFVAVAAVIFTATRSTYRHMRAVGARPFLTQVFKWSPVLMLVGAELGYWLPEVRVAAGLAVATFGAFLVAGVLAPDRLLRALGAYHPLVQLGTEVLQIQREAVAARHAPDNLELHATLNRKLAALHRFQKLSEIHGYLDDFDSMVRHYISGGSMTEFIPVLDRSELQEARFHAELVRLGVTGPVLQWGAEPSRNGRAFATRGSGEEG